MKKLLVLLLLVGGSALAATHISVGIGIGVPTYFPGYYAPAPPPVVAVRPPYPGAGYTWVNGYWAPTGVWVGGYWAPPYRGAYLLAPRYYAPHYYAPRHYAPGRHERGRRDRR
ncbi:MAG: hypothetical protein LAP40_12295 [Acidobacteriia bacterium]|nr:hypothetical protein [Terriglobia bacterium]